MCPEFSMRSYFAYAFVLSFASVIYVACILLFIAQKAKNYNFAACFRTLSRFPKLLNNQAMAGEVARWPVLHQAIKVNDTQCHGLP